MSVIAEIFSQGEEVISGQVIDSNAAWLSQCLTDMGFSVKRHTAVGDDLADLISLIREIAARADCCVCTGGLGPTVDDLTAEAVAEAANLPLICDLEASRQIESYFKQRQRPMPPSNLKQALLPQGAKRIDNPNGSAPGFALKIDRCWFAFLPGVPSEMKAMFSQVRNLLQQTFDLQPSELVTLRSIGIGESTIQSLITDIPLLSNVKLGFRATPEEVQIKLLFPPDSEQSVLQEYALKLAEAIGDDVFAIDGLDNFEGGDLISVIDRGMRQQGLRLTTLESASGGVLAAQCQAYPWLHAGFIARDSEQAARQFNIALATSEPRAASRQLAHNLLAFGADLALIQLHSSELNGYRLYHFLYHADRVLQREHFFPGSHFNQSHAAALCLDLLRRYLQMTNPKPN